MVIALTPEQRRLVTVVWSTYAFYYLGRLNISPALPALADDLGASRAEVGLLGTVFFWLYMVGQLVNGHLGNVLKPRYIVAWGLLVIALVNVAFAFQSVLWVMVVLWGINGFAQATGWGPMIRILSQRLDPAQRERISIYFPMSFQVGNAITWAVAGLLVAWGGWQSAFWVPGLVLLGVLALWWWANTDIPDRAGPPRKFRWHDLIVDWQHLGPLMLAAVFIGFIHGGLAIWLPTHVADLGLFHEALVGVVAGAMALLGIVGMWLSGLMLPHFQLRVILNVFVVALIACLTAAAVTTGSLQLLAVTLGVLTSSAVAGLMLSAVPISLVPSERASSSAGSMTAVYNLGGGAAGVLVGVMLGALNWGWVYGAWALSALVALLFILRFEARPGAAEEA